MGKTQHCKFENSNVVNKTNSVITNGFNADISDRYFLIISRIRHINKCA